MTNVFGKRPSTISAPSEFEQKFQKDDDGVRRIFSKNLWGGPNGDFLRWLGAAPNDANNVVISSAELQQNDLRLRTELQGFLVMLYSKLPPNMRLKPWFMLPEIIWTTEFGEFLMRNFKLYPCSPNNIMLLPDDEYTSMSLGLPVHIGNPPDDYVKGAFEALITIAKELNLARDKTALEIDGGDMDAPLRLMSNLREFDAKIIATSNTLAAILFGEKAYDQHLKLFGKALGWSHAR
jgi:hypothetical protein